LFGTLISTVDPLADVLDLSRVRGALMATVRAGAPWGLALPESPGASFHAVTAGTAWLRVTGEEPLQLMPGDVVLLPSGTAHRVSSGPATRCIAYDRAAKAQDIGPDGELAIGGDGATTTFVCAGYEYDLEVAEPLVGLLPAVVHVRADPVAGRDVAALVELLALEVGARRPGSRAAAAPLIVMLLIASIRRWIDGPAESDGASWLRALRDPDVARVLALLHARPAEPWTLAALAREVHLSRATLARRFAERVGEPPLAYLARWRMHVAAQRLKHSSDTVATIARDVGYTSEFAFNRAFARHRGEPPGRYRRAARASEAGAGDTSSQTRSRNGTPSISIPGA
jgi:AraC-like DNA-binding protein